ncbi:MAG: hypothetical protein LBH07_04845 [Treponema sp.]|nr:hypothetical protein [Treponema sp.]
MKKLIFVLAFGILVIGAASAQGWGRGVVPQSVTVSGTLQLQNGQFTVVSGNTAYYCPMIGQYVGFIDSLKEGSSITIEGFVYGNLIQPTKLTTGGKSYDFPANNLGGYGGYCGGYGGGYCAGPMAGGFGGRRSGRRR